MKSPHTPPKPETVRLTIPVEVRVHEAFTRISKATSVPVGRCMGDWMRDTIDAAEYMATQLEGARSAPRIVAQKLHAYALGVSDETGEFLERVMDSGKAPGAGAGGGRSSPTAPVHGARSTPSSNTGGKVSGASGRGTVQKNRGSK